MKKTLFILFISYMAVVSCTPPEIGYLSEDIHSNQDTIYVPRGGFSVAARPAIENSTAPMEWEIVGFTDLDGNPNNELLDEHQIRIWKESFNGDTDTTLALAEQKLELSNEPSILINKVSGEFAFTQATKFVEGDIFKVDVQVSNIKGSKLLQDFAVIKMQPFQPVEFPVEMRSRLLFDSDNGNYIAHTGTITGPNDENIPSTLDGTNPYFSIQKISEEPAYSVQVNMVIQDSYGETLNPNKVTFYPSGSSYLQNYHDNSVETITDDQQTSFFLPAPPFPQYGRNYTGNSSYLMYYLSRGDAFTVDKEAYEADKGPKTPEEWEEFWAPYRDPVTGNIRNHAYIRWGIKILDSGTWEIKMKIPYTKINTAAN
ncbi:hypothetical protein GCM10007049_21160 [Echinicola pacifica]|uniref:DUF5007 domain-containing protein n=1 Tax=Echinicola pacifica TaxID=346377 RepID=A0A918Q0F4_9BACT|nr:DUF5007 domain-containing protein [Echinicola pacifica]GGZ28021.1 hypothetical protein GCM10007049_21160 [Echinicola pacifica]